MRFTPARIQGAYFIEFEGPSDQRGLFARTFCAREFREQGLNPRVAQTNLCYSRHKGTLRGLHYQVAPASESKLIRCIRGALYDVIIDLRPESPTFMHHVGVELSAENRRGFYIPPMCAHGYQTLSDDAELLYQTGEFYSPMHERGLRYNDPALKLKWPLPVTAISDKDANWPLIGQEHGPPAVSEEPRLI